MLRAQRTLRPRARRPGPAAAARWAQGFYPPAGRPPALGGAAVSPPVPAPPRSPTPMGNLKHGAPSRRGWGKVFSKLMEKRRGDLVAPPGESSDAPQARGRCSGSARRPAAAARREESGSPGADAAYRPGSGGRGSQRADWGRARPGSGLPRIGRPCGPGATRLQAARRASPPASGSSPHLAIGDPPGDPARAGRKVTWAGRGPARRGVGTRPGLAAGRGAQEARAWGGNRRRGLLAALPAPLCRSHRGPAELRRGHTPRAGAEKPTSP